MATETIESRNDGDGDGDGDEEDKQEGDSAEKKSRGNVGRSRQYGKKNYRVQEPKRGRFLDTKSNTMRLSDVIEMRGVGTLIGDGEYSVRRRRRGRRGDASGINKTGKGNK